MQFFSDRNLKQWRPLPYIVCWNIRVCRNQAIFSNKTYPPRVISCWVEIGVKEYSKVIPIKMPRSVGPLVIDKSKPWDYFDGACKQCDLGIGSLFFLHDQIVYKFKAHCGYGTNNMEKLLA